MDETAHLETDLPDVQEALRQARSGYDDVARISVVGFPFLSLASCSWVWTAM